MITIWKGTLRTNGGAEPFDAEIVESTDGTIALTAIGAEGIHWVVSPYEVNGQSWLEALVSLAKAGTPHEVNGVTVEEPSEQAGRIAYAVMRDYAAYHQKHRNPVIAANVRRALCALPEEWATDRSVDELVRVIEVIR